MTTELIMWPTKGEVISRGGLILARVEVGGCTLIHANEGKGFASRMEALDLINRAMREGVVVPHEIDYTVTDAPSLQDRIRALNVQIRECTDPAALAALRSERDVLRAQVPATATAA